MKRLDYLQQKLPHSLHKTGMLEGPELSVCSILHTLAASHLNSPIARKSGFKSSNSLPFTRVNILGTPAALNVPGARQASMSFIDTSGSFWVFGGFDLDSKGNPDALNDLWQFKAGAWTWMSGANVVNQTGVYGTQGVAASTNVPGARWSSGAWSDASGNLWIFGGEGYDSVGNGSLSDVWEFKGGQWIWVKGPASVSQGGIYGLAPGPIIYPYVGNGPGSRFAPGYWYVLNPTDNSVEFWVFGGEGFDSAGANGNGLLSDLWRYLPYP